jgi:hypothetical protein
MLVPISVVLVTKQGVKPGQFTGQLFYLQTDGEQLSTGEEWTFAAGDRIQLDGLHAELKLDVQTKPRVVAVNNAGPAKGG